MATFRNENTEGFTVSKCFSCGEKPTNGGFWMGVGSDATLCAKEGCIEKALHLTLDAIYASDRDIVQDLNNSDLPNLQAAVVRLDWSKSMDRHKKFMAMAERIFWNKESIRLRDILYCAFPIPSEEPVE